MRKMVRLNVLILSLVVIISFITIAQKVETIDGVKLVHNSKQGKWGKDSKISLEFVRTIGDIESEDEDVLFYMPSGIVFDPQANMYVLDTGNHRIQKFSGDGKFLATIGNKGKGPGEFYYPQSMALDKEGFLYVSDSANQRIQILKPDGAVHKTLPLVKLQPGNRRLKWSFDQGVLSLKIPRVELHDIVELVGAWRSGLTNTRKTWQHLESKA